MATRTSNDCWSAAIISASSPGRVEEHQCNVNSRQTPARCQRYLWSRHRQRMCKTIRSSRLSSDGHFVMENRARMGLVFLGLSLLDGVIGPGNRSREGKSLGPRARPRIRANWTEALHRRSATRGPLLPFRRLGGPRLASCPRPGRLKGTAEHRPFPGSSLVTEVKCGPCPVSEKAR